MDSSELRARMAFVVELARRLHQYGTSAPRLEQAIDSVSARLGLNCHSLSTPTSILFSFTRQEPAASALAEHTQVIRVAPGQDDLRNLCAVNEIAERVTDGSIDLAEGLRRLAAIRDRPGPARRAVEAICHGVVAMAVAALLHGSWADLAAAAGIGGVVGLLAVICETRPRLRPALEALCALLATTLATGLAVHGLALDLRIVVLASVIVLLPGLTLTIAVRELSTQHLVSGMARFAGAMTTLTKLAFGAVVGNQLCRLFGLVPPRPSLPPVPAWVEWLALLAASCSFAVLFRAAPRDLPLAIAAAVLGYLITDWGGHEFTPQFGVFLAGACMAALGNAYARRTHRPGSLVRVPGIILLVPGSVGFLSLSALAENDMFPGLRLAISLIGILACLVAGLLFGDLLVAPRRTL
jgi:uncharacterized membrane protein YjjP (DUF1212 family)